MSLAELLAVRIEKEELIAKIKADKSKYQGLIEFTLSDQEPENWRAAWILGHCTEQNDNRLQKYTTNLIEALPTKKDGHQRELLKLIEKLSLDELQEGMLFDQCVSLWENLSQSSSVRFYAMKGMIRIAELHPELKSELNFFTEEHYLNSLSQGVRKSLIKRIKNCWK